MRIAILVWGSLYWDPRNLAINDGWHFDGPQLPIEFARISSDKRLTLVIKPNFSQVNVLYAISRHKDFNEARKNLCDREGTENIDNIGFIDFVNNTLQVRAKNEFVIEILREWNIIKKFDAILWSDFSPLFTDKISKNFTLENVIFYIEHLADDERRNALKYIYNAPQQIITTFREPILQHFKHEVELFE